MKKNVRKFCRKHYKGVLKAISIIEFFSRILTIVAAIAVVAMPSGWESSDRPLWQFVVCEVIAMFFAWLFFELGYSDYIKEEEA